MRDAAQIVESSLSADLKTFAQVVREEVARDGTLPPSEIACIIRAFEMFAVEAQEIEAAKERLERRLLAANCRIAALTDQDFLPDHLREEAISDGKRAGVVVDLCAILDEQQSNHSNDGDAA